MRKMKFQFGHSLKPHSLIPLTVAALAAGVFAAACQQAATDTEATEGTEETPAETSGEGFKLGALLPATGDLASIGEPMLDALPLIVDTVNACGGVNGAPVTLIIEDDQTDPTAGAEGMTKLAEADKVHAVVGSFASSVSGAAVDVAVRNKIPLVSPGSTSPVFTERAQAGDFEGYWARTAPPDTYQAQASAKLAIDSGLTNVATAVINNDYGVGYEKAFVEAFEALGGTVVNKDNPVRYDPKATTLDSEAAAAFGGSPDAVLGVFYVETGALLLKSAYQQGLMEGVKVILTDGVQTDSFPTDVGQTADGSYILTDAVGTVPGAAGPALEAFTALWEEKFGEPPSAYVPQTWDAAAVLILAAQAAGENNGEAIKDQLRNVTNAPGTEVTDICEGLELLKAGEDIDYQGASSKVDIDENGDVVGNYDVWTVNPDGKIAVVDKVILDE